MQEHRPKSVPSENAQITFVESETAIIGNSSMQMVNKKDRLYEFLTEKGEQFYEYLTNMASLPIDKKLYTAMVEAYRWVTWCIHIWTCVKLIFGSYFYHRTSSLTMIFLILIVFSGFSFYANLSNLNLAQCLSLCLLAVCVCDPMLVDYGTTYRSLPFYAPPPLIIPLSISWVIQLMGPNFAHRPRMDLIGTVLAPAVVFYTFYGMSVNGFSLSYLLWALVLLLSAAVDLQMKIGHFREGFVPKCIVYEQFISVFLLICVNYMFIRLFSVRVKHHHGHVPTHVHEPVVPIPVLETNQTYDF